MSEDEFETVHRSKNQNSSLDMSWDRGDYPGGSIRKDCFTEMATFGWFIGKTIWDYLNTHKRFRIELDYDTEAQRVRYRFVTDDEPSCQNQESQI